MRGKEAVAAANRRANAEAAATEEAYRRQIVRLTQERDEARRERDESRAAHKVEVRVLKAHLSEGTSARVEALTHELEEMRAKLHRSRRILRKLHSQWLRLISSATDALAAGLNVTPTVAQEIVANFGVTGPRGSFANELNLELAIEGTASADDPMVLRHDVVAKAKLTVDEVKAIQKARGVR